MSDLTHIHGFGLAGDRKSPLYVRGPGRSTYRWPDPTNHDRLGPLYRDGTADYCLALRQANRWHTESFSFQTTGYNGWIDPIASGKWQAPHTLHPPYSLPSAVVVIDAFGNPIPDPRGDAFAIVPIELDWTKVGGPAYPNESTGVKITHFPVIHTRRGAIGYKLEWWPPGTSMKDPSRAIPMIYTSDTKPEYNCVTQACNSGHGVDVLIHEMIVPAQVYTMKSEYSDELPAVTDPGVEQPATIQASSHSPQGSFGYLLSQINPRPRLTVATHFPVADDTVSCAMESVQEHFPKEEIFQANIEPRSPHKFVRMTWSFDLMVINVSKHSSVEQRADVSSFGFSPWVNYPSTDMKTPKYHYADGTPNPYAQIDTSSALPDCDGDQCNYRDDGY